MGERIMELHSITKFTADSRNDNHVVCYSDFWSKNSFKTWKDFLTDTAKLRSFIQTKSNKDFLNAMGR